MFRRMRAAGGALLAAVSVLLATALLGIAPASASPACHGSTCNQRNPVTTGCSADAVTLASKTWSDHASGGTFGQQTVSLRYSKKCDASWARVTTSAGGTAHVTRVDVWLRNHMTATVRSRVTAGTVYSLMLSGRHRVAVGRSNFNHGAVVQTTIVR